MSAAEPDKLTELRRQIDDLDREILKLLARRMQAVREIGRYKQRQGLAPLDSARWQALLEARLDISKSLGLSEAFITQLYQLIHDYALQIEAEAADKASS